MHTLLGESKLCEDHRDYGLWALDSLNSNVMSTAQSYLEATTADAVFLQELRIDGHPLLAAQRKAARSKWSLAIAPAKRTEADSLSAGVGIAVRSHIGMAPAANLVRFECCNSRVIITHIGAICTGGMFLVSAYFWCNEGASQRNLLILQCIAQHVRQLHGPWILAADFNFPPSVLRSTGWLRLVGGAIVSTGQPTCKGVEDDYFVVDTRLRSAVIGVALVHDTGSEPHSAVRMWLKGRPRRDMLRSLAAPAKAEAFLPQGCLPQSADDGWDDVVDMGRPDLFNAENLNKSFVKWMGRVEDQIADVAGLTSRERVAFCTRSDGPRFVVRSALGCPGSNSRKFSAVTVAWKTIAGWLTDVARAFDTRAPLHAIARARRVRVAFSSLLLGLPWR